MAAMAVALHESMTSTAQGHRVIPAKVHKKAKAKRKAQAKSRKGNRRG